MKHLFFVVLIISFAASDSLGQKYFTKSGDVSFYSEAAMEKIEAHNDRAAAIIDLESGKVEFAVLVKSFMFEKALMQEHFNENYMESDKYPKSVFIGQISNIDEIDLQVSGTHEVVVAGDLTIHGVTQKVEVPATIMVSDGSATARASFIVKCADYGIKIPKVVTDNIAKEIEIKVAADLNPV